jgi:hypothetical protein
MKTPQIPPERWIANLLEAAKIISNRQYQETRWLADDALAWETPDEAICTLDDCVLDGFIEQFAESFSPAQVKAAIEFRDELDRYSSATPLQDFEARKVLADPAWEVVRSRASDFIQAFKGIWPNSTG